MKLPPKIPKKAKRASRWKSEAHRRHVARHACSKCGSMENVEAAHVRIGSGAGMGQKPDDWRLVSLCQNCHHSDQHTKGERTFWRGIDVERLIELFCSTSPRAAQIRMAKQERRNV